MAESGLPRSPLTFDDLMADLSWPRLLRAGRLALRPARVGLGAFFVCGFAILLALADRLDGHPTQNVLVQLGRDLGADARALAVALVTGRWASAAPSMVSLFVSRPADCLLRAPWATMIVPPLLLAWTVIMGGAIARSAATELAQSRTTLWPAALALSLGRRRSLIGSVILPILAIWLIALVMLAASWALFNLPVLRIIGGLTWGLFILGGLTASIMMLGMLLGHPLLVPAVVCEGADTIDAVQHAYAMALSRPVRLLGYVLILAAQGLVLGAVVALVLSAGARLAQVAATAGAGDRGDAIIAASAPGGTLRGTPLDVGDAPPPRPTTDIAPSAFVRVWTAAFVVAGLGVGVSYWWCGCTALFLVMRRVCDGQEISELWSPGMVAGTVVESIHGRSARGVPGPGPSGTGASQAIVDNGPADEG